eukprot:2876910-Prymnesium_polylepis.2
MSCRLGLHLWLHRDWRLRLLRLLRLCLLGLRLLGLRILSLSLLRLRLLRLRPLRLLLLRLGMGLWLAALGTRCLHMSGAVCCSIARHVALLEAAAARRTLEASYVELAASLVLDIPAVDDCSAALAS